MVEFDVGEAVVHQQYGNGIVAYARPGDLRVFFEDATQNPSVNLEPPPYISKKKLYKAFKEKKINYKTYEEWLNKKIPAPLDGHVIWWDPKHYKVDDDLFAPSLVKSYEQYKFPQKAGFFLVNKVSQPMGFKSKITDPWKFESKQPMKSPEHQKERKFFPKKGYIDLKMENTETGESYKVQFEREYTVMPVAKQVPENEVYMAFGEEDVFWSEQPQPQPQQPDEGDVTI